MLRAGFVLVIFLGCSACAKQSGDAVVLAEEHIDARPSSPTVKPDPAQSKSAQRDPSPPAPEYVERDLAADELAVDGFVMKKTARGTSQDPRATTEEQWRVDVQMVKDGRRLTVRTDRVHYAKLKPGDRIKVRYQEGKYTGTVWSAEIAD